MPTTRTSKRGTKSTSSRARKAPKRTAKTAARKAATTAQKAQKRTARKATGAARSATKKAGTATRASKRASKKRASRPASKDALAMLKDDHRTVEGLFKRFEKAGDGAAKSKRRIVDSIIENLSIHAEIEEAVFYPAVRHSVNRVESDVLEALEEHHLVKVVLRELEDMSASDERFDAKVTVMIENVRHHVKEEEGELFPKVRKQLSRSRLVEIGEELRTAKRTVPSRPHPSAPDEPPANVLVGSANAVLDRARTVGKNAVDRVREDVPIL